MDQDRAPIFRPADPKEDDLLSRILCNAFLPLWNHNWFHDVSEPVEPVEVGGITSKPSMNKFQRSRVGFYRSVIAIVRTFGGSVTVVEVPSSDASIEPEIGAILMWFPPEKRAHLGLLTLYSTGFLKLMLPWHYGLTGFYRIVVVYEGNVNKMWSRTLHELPPHGFKEPQCAFVQMLASNPKFAGKGYASALLNQQVEQHFVDFPDRPVVLDTSTTQGVKVYEKLGFKLLAQEDLNTATDKRGMKLKKDASEEVKKEAREVCVQRVMAKVPGGN